MTWDVPGGVAAGLSFDLVRGSPGEGGRHLVEDGCLEVLAQTEVRLDQDLHGRVWTGSAVAAEGVGEMQSDSVVRQQRQAAEPVDLSTSPGVVGMLLHPLVVQLDAVRRVAVVCFVNGSSSSHGGSLRSVVKGHSYYSTFYIIMQLAYDEDSDTVVT